MSAAGTEHDTSSIDSSALLLTVEEAADRLRIGRTTMYALIRSGEVLSVPIGRLRRVPSEALTDYVNRLVQQCSSTTMAA